jgi:phenylpyruvate tautomerase PptA (4-oxalocrotonate tautomerase family)
VFDEELSEDQIDEIEKQIANEFGVDEEDVEIETKYVTEGTLDITVPENVDEEEVIEALTDSLAEMFDVHPKDVIVIIDEDGNVSYEITSGNYTEVEDILDQMNDPNFVNDLTTKIEETNPEIAKAGVVVNDVEPSENIEAVISVIIDGTDATAPENPSEKMNEIATTNGLDSATKVDYYYITSAPTFVPSVSPVTSLPTETPTITGLVPAVEISTEVTSALTTEEVAYIESVVLDSYKVDPEDVSTVVEYVSTGSLILDNIPEDMTEEEVAEILTDILSTTLGVEAEDITITVDPETGRVDYMIIGDSFEEAQDVVELLKDEEAIVDVLNGQLAPESGFTIASVDADEEINAQVTVVVDGDNVPVNPQIAENMVDAMLGEDYTVTSTTTFVTSAPTTFPSVVPSKMPSSSVPTQRPTITGDVVFVDMEKLVNSDLSTAELEEIIKEAEDIFDLYPDNIQSEVSYKTYGEIEFDVTGEIEPEELEESLEQAIAETLGIHPSNVEVTVNEDGTASYVITSDSYEDANLVQEALLDNEIEKDIEAKVVEDVEAISGLEVKPEFGVYAVVELVIDSTNTEDIDNSVDLFDKQFNDTWSMGINSTYIVPKSESDVKMMYRDLDSSVFASNEDLILDLLSKHLDVPVWDIKVKQYGLEKKTELEFVLYSYTKESLDERLLADINIWINLQLEMNEEILGFNDGELYRVCVDDSCLDIMMPTTTVIPTAAPSITGLVITLTVSNEVTEPLSTAEVDEIIQQVYDIYDVEDEDVTHEVEYKVTATLDLEIPEGVSQEDVEEAVVNSIAEELGVHPKDVTILSVDMETGEV